MVLLAAGLLIVVVLGAAVITVGSDLARRPAGQRLSGIKEWQALIGSVLGFMGAAGVLVLGTAIEDDQARAEQAQREYAIGYSLALEAERLASGIVSAIGIANLIAANPDHDPARTCTNFLATLNTVLPRATPVWSAALANTIAFGNDNLSLFVRFYGLHDELIEDARRFDPVWCAEDGPNQVRLLGDSLTRTLDFYRIISSRYGTALVEPLPGEAAGPAAPAETNEGDVPPDETPT